ncbi:MAG: hypothetical protein V4760_19770, partial [Bdellovibrionota bacterium]
MLVFKRALSILLTSLMAMPSVTFAKSPKTPVKSTKQLAQRKSQTVAGKPLRAVKISNGMFPLVLQGKKAFTVTGTKGRGGKLRTRSITGPGFNQTLVDENNDGFVDVLKVTRGSVTTTASGPTRGQFSRIDVERKMKKGVFKAKLLLSYDRTKYELIEQRVYAYGTFHAEAVSGSGTSSPASRTTEVTSEDMLALLNGEVRLDPSRTGQMTNDSRLKEQCQTPQVIESLETLDRALQWASQRTGMTMEAVIKCQLDRFKTVLYDRSCFGGIIHRTWNGSVDSINSGFARVMASHYTEAQGGSGQRNYLQCLDDNGMSVASTGVRQHVFERIRDVSTALMNSGLTSQDVAAAFADVSSCSELREVRGASGARVSLAAVNDRLTSMGSKPSIACSAPDGLHRGEFRNGTVHLFHNPANIRKNMPNCNGCTEADAYASTIFHELVHASGFAHEELVLNTERCCAPMQGSPANRVACSAARATVSTVALRQHLELEMGNYLPDYNLQAGVTTQLFHPNGEEMMGAWQDRVAEVIERSGINRCGVQDQACRDREIESTRRAIETASNNFFDEECPAYASVTSGASCSATKAGFVNMLHRRGPISASFDEQNPRGLGGVIERMNDVMVARPRPSAEPVEIHEVAEANIIYAQQPEVVELLQPIDWSIESAFVPHVPNTNQDVQPGTNPPSEQREDEMIRVPSTVTVDRRPNDSFADGFDRNRPESQTPQQPAAQPSLPPPVIPQTVVINQPASAPPAA